MRGMQTKAQNAFVPYYNKCLVFLLKNNTAICFETKKICYTTKEHSIIYEKRIKILYIKLKESQKHHTTI